LNLSRDGQKGRLPRFARKDQSFVFARSATTKRASSRGTKRSPCYSTR